jgi:hypothetical protein
VRLTLYYIFPPIETRLRALCERVTGWQHLAAPPRVVLDHPTIRPHVEVRVRDRPLLAPSAAEETEEVRT